MAGRESRDDPAFETCPSMNAHETGQFQAPLQNSPLDSLIGWYSVTRCHVFHDPQERCHSRRELNALCQLLGSRASNVQCQPFGRQVNE